MPYQNPEGIGRYFENLYSRFNKDPESFPVLRIDDTINNRYIVGGHLKLQNFSLILVPGDESSAKRVEIDLRQPSTLLSHSPYTFNGAYIVPTITIREVREIIRDAGFFVSEIDTRFADVAATILSEVDDSYDGRSFLSAATAVLWRIFMPIALEGKEQRDQIDRATRQFDLRLSDDIWLDRTANLYGIQRYDGETDRELRIRVNYHVVQRYSNNLSLSHLIDEYFSVENEVIDTLSPQFFYLDDIHSRSYHRSMRPDEVKYTPHGLIPAFSVILHERLPEDGIEGRPRATTIEQEILINHWFCLGDSTSIGQDKSGAPNSSVTVPGNSVFRDKYNSVEYLSILPQQTGRKLWRAMHDYKSAGSIFSIFQPYTVRATSGRVSRPSENFDMNVRIVDANAAVRVIATNHVPTRKIRVKTSGSSLPAPYYPRFTRIVSQILENGVITSDTRIVSYH